MADAGAPTPETPQDAAATPGAEFEAWEAAEDAVGTDEALVVSLDGFEGPLDVLLALARTQKVDLAKISVLALANQYLLFIAELTNDAAIPLLDNVMAQDVALVFYKEIQQAFAGTKTPMEALQAVQDYADQQQG